MTTYGNNVKFLVFVDPRENHNKYYRMIDNGDNTFTAEYGRIGAAPQTKKYPMSKWDILYSQKLQKGYKDTTDLHDVKVISDDGYAAISDPSVAQLVLKLRSFANDVISANYSVKAKEVSPAMINKAQDILDSMLHISNVRIFNDKLVELFSVIPRAMRSVDTALAKDAGDFMYILDREQRILDVMAGSVTQYNISSRKRSRATVPRVKKPSDSQTILETLGLTIRPCTPEENMNIKKHLTAESSGKFKAAWRVNNQRTDEDFDQYMKDHHLLKCNIHFLYHGSRNENWWSIIGNGLCLNPKAIITGKMFGNGLYFAPRAKKSIGYTSLEGSYWAKGTSHTGFLAVYKVAYKHPEDVYSFDPYYKNYNTVNTRNKGIDSVFAHKGSMLKNDELIVYDPAQTTIQYLIELEV